jgi:nitrite reductase/ring-hydroxylating ferredoxin subunit
VSAPLRLGPLADIPVGEGRAYAVGGEQIAVFRLGDRSVRALSAVCPHAGGPLADGQIDGEVLICPLHLHVFELATGCSRTGQPGLRVYPVAVDDRGDVVLDGPLDQTPSGRAPGRR